MRRAVARRWALSVAATGLLLLGSAVVGSCGTDPDPAASVPTVVRSSASEPAGPPAGSGLAPVGSVEASAATDASATVAAATGLQASPAPVIPTAVAGVPLTGSVGGDEARAQVEQLHGKTLGQGMDEAWVAQYGQGEAILWVTRAARDQDARDLYERMYERIGTGGSPFTAQQPIHLPGVEGFSLEGLGQQHYYFLVGGDLYWLAVDAPLAAAGLEQVVAQARSAVGVE